jgi:acyl transferase domain-containing protein/SAM-dependent methyltransferase
MADELDPQTWSPAKRALYELRSARARIEELERAQHEPIAIIGMGARFPGGVTDPETLWRVLHEGRDTITEIPADRWDVDAYYDPDPDTPGKMYTRHGAFLDHVDRFDAPFFGISPREAAAMDPQQRLLLEVAWEALENAGQSQERVRTEGGVFVALSNSDYSRLVMRDPAEIDVYSSTGNNFSIAAGRLSYILGWRGPSLVVDTACSGSLVAVHLACQSLRAGECRVALAGGVNLILTPEININFSKARMMAPDGHCKTFDASADGYVRGEGAGVVVLKRLTHAVADGDRVLAVIAGSAINQDGQSGGLTVPNGPSQEAVIRRALADSQLTPADIGYIEAHGTGTALGDPIEAHALAAVFGHDRPSTQPLVLGSLKTNLGHLESAAGVAGLMKAVLALQHEAIPAHLHFRTMNPHIDWNGLPVVIPTAARPWPRGATPRRAGVSSFGFSGTNAHVIVEEAPATGRAVESTNATQPQILALSARSDAALTQQIAAFRTYLEHTTDSLADICDTANAGRTHFAERAAFVASNMAELRAALTRAPVARGTAEGTPDVVFLFTGQGAQWPGMGNELYHTQPVFRAAIDECACILDPQIGRSLVELICSADATVLDQTIHTQPAVFAMEWALAQLWKSWGITPSAVFGHSVGEYAALCVAGVWALETGLTLITERAKRTSALPSGWGMSAVQSSTEELDALLSGLDAYVSIAAINGANNFVLSGREAELSDIEQKLRERGALVTRLRISHGFHSAQMESVAGDFARLVTSQEFREPVVPVISSVTGRATTLDELRTTTYWYNQVRHTVRFDDGMATLAALGLHHFLEVSPAPVLIGMGQQCLDPHTMHHATWSTSLRKDRGAWDQMLESLGALYVHGARVAWDAVPFEATRGRVSLPTYPFERQRYWIRASSVSAPSSTWPTIRDAASWQAQQGRLDLSTERYARGWDILDRLTTAYIVDALVQLGAFQTKGERHTVESLVAATGIQSGFTRLVARWLQRVAEAGLLVAVDKNTYRADRPLTPIAIEPVLQEASATFGPDRYFLDYIVSCGSQLRAYVTGAISTLETLFPGGSFDRAEDVYERAPLSAYFAGIGRATLDAIVRTRGGAPLRVVELGAGTGSTTSALLPVMPSNGSVYYFTDLSDFFLNHAREKFARYDSVRFGHFNAERPGAEQGYADASFDVVVATNVLHATHDLRETLRHTRALLAPGGVLILCEVTTYLSWFDITTGLIEGWQLFSDGLRGDHPLLPATTWTSLLSEAGFEHILALPDDGSPAAVLGQHVIVAQVPGHGGSRRQDRDADAANLATPTAANAAAQPSAPLRERLAESPASERQELLVELVRNELAASLRVTDPATLDRKRRLIELGIDSLIAVELRNRLAKALTLAQPLPATLVFDHPTIEALATYLARDILRLAPQDPGTRPAETDSDGAAAEARAAELEQLSEEEAEALLLRRLQSL